MNRLHGQASPAALMAVAAASRIVAVPRLAGAAEIAIDEFGRLKLTVGGFVSVRAQPDDPWSAALNAGLDDPAAPVAGAVLPVRRKSQFRSLQIRLDGRWPSNVLSSREAKPCCE